MKEGLCGLFKLEGNTLGEEERDWLGISSSDTNTWLGQGAGFVFFDSAPLPGDSAYVVKGDCVIGFLGDLDNRESLTASLALPIETSAGLLVWTLIQRSGEQALNSVEGLWTFWVWDSSKRQLTIAVSRHLRDSLYLAVKDDCLALSPSIQQLRTLPWLPTGLDELGLLLSLGRASLRAKLEDRTWQQGVKRLLPGTIHTIGTGAHTQSLWAKPLQAVDWQGSFEEAVLEMEQRARQAVRNRIRRHRTIAVLLSGGMDSSVLAWLAAQELRPDQRLIAVSSVANESSGIQDERHWIDLVAKTLGIEVHYVSPERDESVYFPSFEHFTQTESPMYSPRYYLYEKLFAAAHAAGADAVLDGCYGEQSLTRSCKQPPKARFGRGLAKSLISYFRSWRGADLLDLFHVPIRSQVRAFLPAEITRNLNEAADFPSRWSLEKPMGFPKGYSKAALNSEKTSIPGLRRLLPFRAPDLVSFSAALPGQFVEFKGQSRAIVRALLSQAFPPELYQRTDKKPFCPEHVDLLQHQAAAELLRLDSCRSSPAWDLIDEGWLREALAQTASGKADQRTRDAAQGACTVLAFFDWYERTNLKI